MTDLRKAAEMALEAFEMYLQHSTKEMIFNQISTARAEELRQALAQPEQECTCPAKDMHFGKCCKAKPDEVLAEREACAKLCDELAERGFVAEGCAIAIRARSEKPPVKSYCGGKPNYCTPEVTPEVTTQVTTQVTEDVDAVNMTQKPVDETAKGEHEPFIYVREDNERPFGGYEHCSEADAGAFPVYTAPMIYTPRPKKEWVGLTHEERDEIDQICRSQMEALFAVEAKLKEKNNG